MGHTLKLAAGVGLGVFVLPHVKGIVPAAVPEIVTEVAVITAAILLLAMVIH